MYGSTRLYTLLSVFCLSACHGAAEDPQGGTEVRTDRISDRAVVACLQADPQEPWWIEETLAPWPALAGDRDLGLRQIVRTTAAGAREVVWAPADPDRLTAAVVHGQGVWSAVGVDGERRPFLVRGEGRGVRSRIVLDDPALAADGDSWFGDHAPTALRAGILSEDSVRIGGSQDEVVVSLMTEHNAVLVYRWRWDGASWQRGPRTLVTPASPVTPFLPIGASYDNFDAVANPYHAPLAVAKQGHAYVAFALTWSRLRKHNEALGTQFDPLRSDEDLLNRPSDLLLTRIEPDGTRAWSRLVGTADVDDEVYAVAVDPDGGAGLAGRARRERGRDGSEWDVTVTTLDAAGRTTAKLLYDAADSGIAQAAAFAADGSLWVGGTEGWLQNPSGISLYQEGRPFLLQLQSGGSAGPARLVPRPGLLPSTTGHSELRALAVSAGKLWTAGLERGPLTHTGDADRSRVRSDGFWSLHAQP